MLTTERRLDLLLEPGVGRGERRSGALDDRVDRAGRQLDPEQLARELGRVAAGDTVADGERHDRCLQPRPERRPRQRAGKLGPRRGGTAGAADAVQPVLAHAHRDRRQFRDLVSPRLRRVDQLLLGEHTRARATPRGPMLDHLVDLLGREQPSVPAFVSGLAAALAAGARPTRPRRCRGRILRGRQRRVARTAAQPPLELRHPRLEPLIRLNQLADPQKQRDRRLPIAIEDRLRLGPLHATQLRRNTAGPCAGSERLHEMAHLQA